MSRKRAAQLRPHGTSTSREAEELGLPAVSAEALDRLGEPGLDPLTVAEDLREWRSLVRLPVSTLSAPHNDWIQFIGPSARSSLEAAVQALNRRDGAPLRAELALLDAEFERKTSHNPLSDPALPWWARRWTD